VRQRAGGIVFALVLNLLLLLALFTLSPQFEPPKVDDRLPVTFDVETGEKTEQQQAKAEKTEKREKQSSPQKQADPVVRPPVPVEKPAEQPPSPFPFLTLNREQMASADIGNLPKGTQGVGEGKGNSSAVQGPGEGPGGVQLYEAEWYRRPTHAELSTYLPANAPARGYGLVACKTIDHYHVENCQILGEYPLGSGLAKAVRLAAWQFLVRPPRVNGKQMVGSWVRIRIDYTRTLVPGGPGAGPDPGLGQGPGDEAGSPSRPAPKPLAPGVSGPQF
jgi:protein TonB